MTSHVPVIRNPGRSLPPPAASDLQLLGEFLKMALRHKTILALWLLAAAAGGVVYWLESTPRYQSKAQVLVARREPRTLPHSAGK